MTSYNLLKFTKKEVILIVAVAFGYFVDVYDILLFSAVRKPSLQALGVTDSNLADVGLTLLNWQLFGMILGGILWGVYGDKKGRKKALFGSILFYSCATFLNAYVTNIDTYKIVRFIAGFGLAGELGAGITLITENVEKNRRTIGTTIVATFGMLGGVIAALVASKINWQISYMIGGGMGFVLLIFRIAVSDSILFDNVKEQKIKRGNFFGIFQNAALFKKYIWSILVGAPTYVFAGLFITLSPEFSIHLGLSEPASAAIALIYFYICLTIFDGISGLLSKYLKSRRKAIIYFLIFQTLAVILYLYVPCSTLNGFYIRCGIIGASLGYWTVLITNAAEQFGTNLRATVATSVPNFARGLQIPLSFVYKSLLPGLGIIHSSAIVSLGAVLIAFLAINQLKDNFENNANFVE